MAELFDTQDLQALSAEYQRRAERLEELLPQMRPDVREAVGRMLIASGELIRAAGLALARRGS